MKKLSILIVSFIAFLGIQGAKAWGGVGHSSIVYVAEQHLTPEAKEKCYYYLKHTLAYYASWMDYWRSIPEYKSVNNPHSIRTEDGRNIDWGGKPSGRAMGHLVNAVEELGNGKYKNLPDSVVRQRLINMIHYVPDMHCPSHCGFPEKFYPKDSKYKITRKGKKANYHSFWDGSPGFMRKNITLKKYAEMVDVVSPKESKKWQKGLEKRDLKAGIGSWGKDCIQRAKEAREIIPQGTDIAKMPKEQQKQVHDLADRAILVGGYRLAYVLNTIFKE